MNIAVMIHKLEVVTATFRSFFVAAISSMLLCISMNAVASTAGVTYTLDLRIADPSGSPRHRVTFTDLPYSFGAAIHSPIGTPQVTVDLYFGVIAPGGMTLSWVKDGDPSKLVSGFQPLLTSVDLAGGQQTDTAYMLGGDLKYRFTGKEPKGMYTVFVIFVRSGTNASNSDNWVGVSMTPLFTE